MGKRRSNKSNSKSKGTDSNASSVKNTEYPGSINQSTQNAAYREAAAPPRPLLSSFAPGSRRDGATQIPHRGSLCRIDSTRHYSSSIAYQYAIEIKLENGTVHDLRYEQQHYEFMSRLFAILDTESRGSVGRAAVMEFVTLRCPVFWRRDNDLRRLGASTAELTDNTSPTFDEVWTAVAQCSNTTRVTNERAVELGVEGWMVFCRFIALAQYLEAKRRFSARHLQQTMRHRNSPRGSEVVVVDVPPPEPPAPLTPSQLAEYERKVRSPLPLPELDLDHCLVAARDVYTYHHPSASKSAYGKVQISLFGSASLIQSPLVSSSSTTPFSSSNLEFAVTYTPSLGRTNDSSWGSMSMENAVVRRSMDDMKWLNDTFTAHKKLGGTLCGRIMPPFPSSSYQTEDSLRNASAAGSGGAQMAMEAAAAGVDLLTSVAKSFWGSYVTPSSSASSKQPSNPIASTSSHNGKKTNPRSLAIPENYYNANSPVGKARQLERYLNYLLEHPALSTSFALNTILKASQSGLEAAKRSVRDHAKSLKQQQSQAPQLHNHPAGSPTSTQPNLSWVRTAAQAAMALKVHGMLETSGLPSASARLQHASLPSFEYASRNSAWADEEDRHLGRGASKQENSVGASGSHGHGPGNSRSKSDSEEAESFERGVVQVESELGVADGAADALAAGDDGYDLLPDPVPAPERRILCAGSAMGDAARPPNEASARNDGDPSNAGRSSTRFHYGSPARRHQLALDADETQHAFLEDISVDDDIDKLREVIGSVDNTLSRCLNASGGIGGARRKRLNLHLEIVRGFDSWEGLRGKFIAQRALLKGVSGLEQSRDVSEESDLELIDDISWQASLANSAVSAAEDVRSTVRAARTAANAKAAADAASLTAQNACENGKFSSVDEARAAQTRSSIAQSHAIHAAVVEHEAKTAKRRATLALAHDVKCWNVHRKRELLRTCLRSARSQLEASRRAVDAWSCLRDGYVGSPVVPFADTRRTPYNSEAYYSDHAAEASATIFSDAMQNAANDKAQEKSPEIKPVDHNLLSKIEIKDPGISEALILPSTAFPEEEQAQPPLASLDADVAEPEISVPVATGNEAPADTGNSASLPAAENSQPDISAPSRVSDEAEGDEKFVMAAEEKTEDREKLSESMQSLVDGLMAWGGQYDSEEDVALPTGMAASIAFEETGLMGS